MLREMFGMNPLSQARMSRELFEKRRLDFIQTRLEMAITFVSLLTTASPDTRRHNIGIARTARDEVKRFLVQELAVGNWKRAEIQRSLEQLDNLLRECDQHAPQHQ